MRIRNILEGGIFTWLLVMFGLLGCSGEQKASPVNTKKINIKQASEKFVYSNSKNFHFYYKDSKANNKLRYYPIWILSIAETKDDKLVFGIQYGALKDTKAFMDPSLDIIAKEKIEFNFKILYKPARSTSSKL